MEDWKTIADECNTKCGVGPVVQRRKCSGSASGCNKVQKQRWVTCDQGGCNSNTGILKITWSYG